MNETIPLRPVTSSARRFARALLTDEPPEGHPFVAALFDGSLPREVALAAALDVGHVVACFPRFLAAVLANVEDWRDRMELVENLYEEHGALQPSRVHEVTYRGFLETLGLDARAIDAHSPSLGVVVYRRAVLDLCRNGRVAESLGALGVIEEIVARVSVAVRRWASLHAPGREHHFSVHETLDLRHADELYALAEPHHRRDPAAVELGMRLGHYHHLRLYGDVAASAGWKSG
jgi:pyrroloquinoline quinone (PQQ) biosynthesis protein C